MGMMSIRRFKRLLDLSGKMKVFKESLKRIDRGRVIAVCDTEDGRQVELPLRFTVSHVTGNVIFEEEDVVYEPVPEGIGAVEIEHEISVVRARLYDYCLRIESQKCLDDLQNGLPEEMQKGFTARDFELSHIGVRAAFRYGHGVHLNPMILTEAFCMDAMKALTENNLVLAWYCLERAQWWSSEEVLPENPKKQGREKAQNAAKVRSEMNFGWIRAEVLKLLECSAPPDGWKNPNAAATALTPLMSLFIEQKLMRGDVFTNLKLENLHQTIYTWIRENDEIMAAFERTRRQDAVRQK